MNTILIILGMGLCAFLPRYLPVVLLGDRPLPPKLQEALDFVPPAILAAIVAPALLMTGPESVPMFTPGNRFLVAGSIAFVIGAVWKSPLTACGVSSALFFAWPWLRH